MSDPEVAASLTTEGLAYLDRVAEWLKDMPKDTSGHDGSEEFWCSLVAVEWSSMEGRFATFRAEEDWWTVDVHNG